MNISVEYKDTAGIISNRTYKISRLAFAKHLAIAGQGYSPRPTKLFRTLGMFLHYSYYIHKHAFDNDRFSQPPIELSDPTEKGQFSNLAGKAIADFLSKRIDHSLYTVNYEAAMRLKGIPLTKNGKQVSRPDLIAFTRKAMLAIEAKGYSGHHGNMNDHKNQSTQGGIPVNYTVASVSYNLYNKVKCNYYDPFNDNVQFDNDLFRGLTKDYYKGLSAFLDLKMVQIREFELMNEKFYEIGLLSRDFKKLFEGDSFHSHFLWREIFDHYHPSLILPKNIKDYAETGITNETVPFLFYENEHPENIYIDNDRVGLRLGW